MSELIIGFFLLSPLWAGMDGFLCHSAVPSALMALFTSGISLTGVQRLMLMLPLCLSIAIVYKTTRCEDLRQVPLAALALWVTIVLGMATVGIGLWAAFAIMV